MKKIYKVIIVVFTLGLIVGCGNMMNTPTKKVEQFLSKYQTMDKSVLDQLDDIMDDAATMTDEQTNDYQELMKKQYQNLSYKIKDETEDGNNATVEVELEVYDYGKAISESEQYLVTNRNEFLDESLGDIVDTEKFLDYKIEQMNNVKDKIKYTITFNLTKEDDKWQLNDLSNIDIQKLHGLYY